MFQDHVLWKLEEGVYELSDLDSSEQGFLLQTLLEDMNQTDREEYLLESICEAGPGLVLEMIRGDYKNLSPALLKYSYTALEEAFNVAVADIEERAKEQAGEERADNDYWNKKLDDNIAWEEAQK